MRSRGLGILTVAIGCGAAPHLNAQSLAIQAVAAHSSHSLVGNLLGGAVVFSLPVHADAVSLQVGVAHLVGSSTSIATTCHGFIVQDQCDPEPVAGDARLTHGSLELAGRLWRTSQVAVRVIGGLSVAEVHAAWRGLSTSRNYSGDRTWWGAEVGLEGTLSPWRRLPLALQVNGALTRLGTLQTHSIADAYTPLDVSSTLATVRLGIVWRPRQ